MLSENPNPAITQPEPQPDTVTHDAIVIELTTQLATARAEIEALKKALQKTRNHSANLAAFGADIYKTSR